MIVRNLAEAERTDRRVVAVNWANSVIASFSE